MTITLPRLRITRHFSQILRTDALTFMPLFGLDYKLSIISFPILFVSQLTSQIELTDFGRAAKSIYSYFFLKRYVIRPLVKS